MSKIMYMDTEYAGSSIELIDVFYPVGSYYETSDTTFDPNVTWGGTWVQENAGLFHRSATTVSGADADSGKGIADGGASTVTLTASQTATKAHSHNYAKPNANTGGHTLTTDELPAHTHGSKTLTGKFSALAWGGTNSGIVSKDSQTNNLTSPGSGSSFGAGAYSITATHTHNSVGGGSSHNHSISTTATATTSNPSDADATDAHENKPPYVDVVRWHRTA